MVKAKPKAKAKAKPKIKITKEPTEPIKEEVTEEEEVIKEEEVTKEEPPKKIYKNKQMVNCPDCNLSMTQHTLKHVHKKEDTAKEHLKKKKLKKKKKSHLVYRSRSQQKQ